MANELIFVPGEGAYEAEGSTIGYTGMWIGYYTTPLNGAVRILNINQTGSVNFAMLMIYASAVDPSNNQAVKAKIRGLDYDNYGYLPDNNPFSGKDYTSAYVNKEWSSTVAGSWIDIECTSIVNEIMGRGGWSSGNAMAFIAEDNGTATDKDRYVWCDDAYLIIRKSAVPDFTPDPTTISAPSLPDTEDWGIKISKPGSSVLDCPENDLFFTTRRKTVKVLTEDIYTSTGEEGDWITISHNLGYVPFVSVFGLEIGSSNWKKLPLVTYFTDRMTYYLDDTNLYLHSAQAGEKFYYRIFVDRLTT